MKKTLLTGLVSLLWLTVPVKAQLQKSTRYVAATINFNGSSQRDYSTPSVLNNFDKTSSFGLSPSFQFGRFVKENKMIGVGIGADMNFFKSKRSSGGQEQVSVNTNMRYNVSPYIRHYKSLSPKWAIFLNSSIVLSYLHYKSTNYGEAEKSNGYLAGLQLTPGISYWISPRFALETDLNFLSLAAGYQHLPTSKNVYFNSAVTTSLTSYFSVRASWYLQKN
jgi:hypothetical protein